MKKFYCSQCSDDWYNLRKGIPTASQFHRIITSKMEYATIASARYIHDLINESKNLYRSPAMQYGIDTESEARKWLELVLDKSISEIGFILSDCERFGCSPDGLIDGEEIGVEIKCPQREAHSKFLDGQPIPHAYYAQIQGSLLITGYEKWYFLSYRHDMPHELRVVHRDEAFIQKLKQFLDYFNEELNRARIELCQESGS